MTNPTAMLHVVDTASSATGIKAYRIANDASGAMIYMAKARGTTLASRTSVQVGDYLGYFGFGGYVSGLTANADGAAIHIVTTGVTAAGVVADLFFATSDGSSENATERMRLTSAGRLGIGVTDPQYTLDINGDIHLSAGHHIYRDGVQIL